MRSLVTAHVPLPDLIFRDGAPFAQGFDDVYFSKAGGVAETTHVFLKGNGLPERFASHANFTIGELGFGTGLNFLVAWDAFLKHAPAGHHLHFVSLEKFPLTPVMLREALASYPEFKTLSEQLIENYPLRLPGLHRVHFPRVTLTLGFGDAEELLPQIDACIDAWFLDGFAPAKNADMWSLPVLNQVGRMSAAGTTFATFTSAGNVRRGLSQQGFAVEKVPGFGHKREMSTGKKMPEGDAPLRAEGADPSGSPSATQRPLTTLVVGAGIAGCTIARALAERGVNVTVLERGRVAGGASGNPAAVLFPQLPKRWSVNASWYFTAYSFMLRQLARWRREGLKFGGAEIGMLRLPRHAEEEKQLYTMELALGLDAGIAQWVTRERASHIAGVALATGAAYFPRGTWLSPAELCQALIAHPNITVKTSCEVISLTHRDGVWSVKTPAGESFSGANCCIAVAHESAAIFSRDFLRVSKVGGQISEIAASSVAATISAILCHKSYLIPHGKTYLAGATYNHGDDSLLVTPENHQKNLAEIATFLPDWVKSEPIGGRTAFRATTPDRMPYVGEIEPGLFVSLGHGSRGFLSAPLAAEEIASRICGEVSPLTAELRATVDPWRFNK